MWSIIRHVCNEAIQWLLEFGGKGLWSLQWRHNGRDSVSNHQPHDCLLNRLFGHRSKKTSKLHVTGLCEGNSPGTGEFPAQRASTAENASIWWRHHGYLTAPLWECMIGIGDHRFTFFMDLLPNHTFFLHKSDNTVHWDLPALRRCDKPDNVQFMKSWEKYVASFDAGLS